MEALAKQVNFVCNEFVALVRSRPIGLTLSDVRDMFAPGLFSPLAPVRKVPIGTCRPQSPEADLPNVSYESGHAAPAMGRELPNGSGGTNGRFSVLLAPD